MILYHFPTKSHYPWPHLLHCTLASNSFFCSAYISFVPFFPSLPFARSLSGARLHDLSWWLGQWRGPADVRRADGQIQPGSLLSALGIHLGHHGHPGRSHPLLPGLRPGEPAGWTHDRRVAGWEQGWESTIWSDNSNKREMQSLPAHSTGSQSHVPTRSPE